MHVAVQTRETDVISEKAKQRLIERAQEREDSLEKEPYTYQKICADCGGNLKDSRSLLQKIFSSQVTYQCTECGSIHTLWAGWG